MSESQLSKFIASLLLLPSHLYIKQATIDKNIKEVHIVLDFNQATKFKCPICSSENTTLHDRSEKTWRYMSMFQYPTYIHFAVPRVKCINCGVHEIETPWAQPK
jgi:transposase